MASIASVYIEVLPTTGRIAEGIAKALRSADDAVIKAARRWKKDIDRELGNAEVDVSADTAQAKKDIKEVGKGRYTAKVKVDVDQASLAKTRANSAAVWRWTRRVRTGRTRRGSHTGRRHRGDLVGAQPRSRPPAASSPR